MTRGQRLCWRDAALPFSVEPDFRRRRGEDSGADSRGGIIVQVGCGTTYRLARGRQRRQASPQTQSVKSLCKHAFL